MAGGTSLRTIGILGGMGPLATIEFMKRILEKTPAESDQDHVPEVVLNFPQIPDRTEFLLGKGEDPRPILISLARKLEEVGAEAIFMLCNTAHAFYDEISHSVGIPVFHMPARALYEAKMKGIDEVLLLTTLGTYLSKIYEKFGRKYSVDLIIPEENFKRRIHSEIYCFVKSGRLRRPTEIISKIKREFGRATILLGCTELSILKPYFEEEFRVIDPLDVAAEYAVGYSLGRMSDKDLLPP